MLLSPLADQAVAYDLVTETAHHLNATAGALLAACDGTTDPDEAVAGWADATGTDPDVVAADVEAGLATLRDLGVIGRPTAFVGPKPPVGCTADATEGSARGAVHPVLDWAITFRSPQPELLATIDAFLGTGVPSSTGAPLVFDVHEQGDGQVRLVTDYEWLFPNLAACLNQLTSVINEYAVWTHTCASLHAGAVRSPTGEIVLLAAPSGGGKSTLTGAFVAAGWDYLGDEAIGIRPGTCTAVGYPKRLAIDASSRMVLGLPDSDAWDLDPAELRPGVHRLGGDIGPITRVVLPTYVGDAELTIEDLDPPAALDALLPNTVNLARAGQPALDALCDLATTVPACRFTHGDARQVVSHVRARLRRAGGEPSSSCATAG